MIFGHLPAMNLYHPFLLLAKGTLTGVGQFRPMNWVFVKDHYQYEFIDVVDMEKDLVD